MTALGRGEECGRREDQSADCSPCLLLVSLTADSRLVRPTLCWSSSSLSSVVTGPLRPERIELTPAPLAHTFVASFVPTSPASLSLSLPQDLLLG